jgi:hypothetical protein
MNATASFGMVFGLMVGLVIAVILLKFSNKDHKFKTQYDERQEFIKGRGYKYSFYTLLYLEALLAVLEVGNISFGIEKYLVHFIVILISLAVLCVHSIWNGVYWGLNNNRKRYSAIIVIAVALNLIPVISSIARGSLSTDGFNSLPILNIIVLIWMGVIGICALAKKCFATKGNEED